MYSRRKITKNILLIEEEYQRFGIPKNKASEWAKREASQWPFKVCDDFYGFSARMYYEAALWGESQEEPKRKSSPRRLPLPK